MFAPVHLLKMPRLTACTSVAFGILLATQALAAPPSYTKPNVIATAEPTSVTLNGQTFVNQGLQGVARLPASTVDFNGDTFGAFSGLDVLPGTWRKTATGYTGVLYSLPDRGPNGVGTVTYSDYAARVSSFNMSFTPYTSAAALPVSADSQHQLALTQTGGFFFKDFNGKVTTGFDPGTGATAFVTQNGMSLPGSSVGAAAGKISLDAEGLRFLNNGNFYVSDEYGANVYYFDKSGNLKGVIQPPAAVIPRLNGELSFSSVTNAATGRRVNQGLEGLAITPDNKKLVTLLQSATMQDSSTSQETRTNTRLMIYDISQNAVPTTPIADYIMQLPIINATGSGTAPNRAAAQSELLALNDTQFLVLARDGNGLGQALLDPVYKSVLLIDTAGATNIAGTPFENSTTPLAPGGVLNSTITPVSQVEVVNILNTTQLGKFGLNINNKTPTRLTLTEKLEGMALVPVLDESAPQDFFLLVANDNDFLSSTCKVGGQDCAQPVDSDALVLMYRLTLPTYVDSQYLRAMTEFAPSTVNETTRVARELAQSSAETITQRFVNLRHAAEPGSDGMAVWVAGGGVSRDNSGLLMGTSDTELSIGLDANINAQFRVGAALAQVQGEAESDRLFNADHVSYQFSVYGTFSSNGLYATAIATHADLRLDDLQRAAAYGLTAYGDTDGNGYSVVGEVGYMLENNQVRFGPLAGVRWLQTDIAGYTENGAAGGNIVYPTIKTDGTTGYVGGEVSMATANNLRSILRLTYADGEDVDGSDASLRLHSTSHAMGTQLVTVGHEAESEIEASFTLTGQAAGKYNWWLNYAAKDADEAELEHSVKAGLVLRF
jgi:uncharacterized protein YhjY with autotransporter beta-barrel domain